MQPDSAPDSSGTPHLSRRKVLSLLGAAAAAPLVGRARAQGAVGPVQPTRMPWPACVVKPEQTEGPYFVDTKLDRSDIRPDPSDGAMAVGLPLHLVFRVGRIGDNACSPLAGAVVDVWQCDALGVYSGVRDMGGRFDTRGKQFLRGHQVTDAEGTARFTTVYPGWYQGRAVHIHFKIRTDPAADRGHEFTSQLYFDEALTDAVHALGPYAAKSRRTTTNAQDGIFRRGGDQLMLHVTEDENGYTGAFDIGLEMV